MPPLTCRFYEHRFPEIDDVVMATVLSIAEMGAYVHLLEYNKIEGMILLSELSRRRIRSINKLIRVGRDECVVVIRVDKDKGYIDLSKRRVSPEEVIKCEEKFAKAKCVNSILSHVAQLLKYETDSQLEDLYQKTAWMFDRKYGKPGASYDVFKQAVSNADVLSECEIDDETRSVLLANVKRRLTPHAVKIRTDIEVACYGYEGVDAVKESLRQGLNLSTVDMPIKINLIAPPLYVMTTQTLERAEGIIKLEEALRSIQQSIENNGGTFAIKMQPKVVSDIEELELAQRLKNLERENEERSGDEESHSSDDDEATEGVDPTVVKQRDDLDITNDVIGNKVNGKGTSNGNVEGDEEEEDDDDMIYEG